MEDEENKISPAYFRALFCHYFLVKQSVIQLKQAQSYLIKGSHNLPLKLVAQKKFIHNSRNVAVTNAIKIFAVSFF